MVRRLVHSAIALFLLLLVSPVMLGVALLVRLSSPGPVFFRQERVGQDGTLFRIYKLRTMRLNSGGPQVTGRTDPGITPCRARLRHWELGAAPQVLKGVKGG